MQISRKINGNDTITVELSNEELRQAHEEYEFIKLKEEIQDVADSRDIDLPDDFPFEEAVEDVKHYRKKDINYMAGYWGAISFVLSERTD